MQMYFNKGDPPALAASKLSTWRMIYFWGLTSFPEFQSYIILKNLRCEWLSQWLFKLSRRARRQGTLFLPQFSTVGLRALIQSEHNHHGSDAALLLFGISYTRDAEMKNILHRLRWRSTVRFWTQASSAYGVRRVTPWELQPCQDTLQLQLSKGQAPCHARQHSMHLRWVFLMEITITQPLLTHWLFSLLFRNQKDHRQPFSSRLFTTLPRGSNPSLASGSSRDLTADYKNSLLH